MTGYPVLSALIRRKYSICIIFFSVTNPIKNAPFCDFVASGVLFRLYGTDEIIIKIILRTCVPNNIYDEHPFW